MRGIILAGGSGTRLRPLTSVHSKQLLPVYDKPMIYYPLSVLMQTGIREILIISTPEHLDVYRALLGDGSHLGIRLDFAEQVEPKGLAEALLIGSDFVGSEQVCLILGDNIFYGHRLPDMLRAEAARLDGCTLFGYPVSDPERYGVAEVDEDGAILSLEEKPANPRSNLAVTGLYLYDNDALRQAAELTPSARGELEITDLNLRYVDQQRARLVNLGRGSAWFDTGTHDSLLEASLFVQLLEKRQGIRISCLEEVAYHMGYIDAEQLIVLGKTLSPATSYGRYVLELAGAA
ncbi:glucose-1-phosphate thymidylyltransferase RfbA [Streptomyces sp. VRA16 Mangrove soil]|uniref:glucose-1-phosphate thymidylyltransferase RfbA n=1 Tax=Streptomyces sp. VRA16 Mangrove soil TaxID=2817434 RepID=UPI001A9FCFD2|nr:glucose-1-phosphate thymidylyltransferase RfbA [Streptomyces sp. VRA16 Mangrove soil]MBO1337168.1 glucose-1-phosphate thymidylyltransferase RfbA [Streptomyces sp. VRA16 Mangrove soil]